MQIIILKMIYNDYICLHINTLKKSFIENACLNL